MKTKIIGILIFIFSFSAFGSLCPSISGALYNNAMLSYDNIDHELFDAYPPFLSSNGKLLPLKNIAKKFNTLDEFFFAYSSAIKHDPEKHKEVMELLEWGKNNNQITYGLLEFVISQK